MSGVFQTSTIRFPFRTSDGTAVRDQSLELDVLKILHNFFLLQVPVTVHREQSMETEDQQDATIRCLLLTSVSTCFGHHYAHLQENKGPGTAFGVLFWFCWMWLVAVVGALRCRMRALLTKTFVSRVQKRVKISSLAEIFVSKVTVSRGVAVVLV